MPKIGDFISRGKYFLKPDGGLGGIYGIKNKSERTRYYAGKTTRNMVS
jgi:hypothetical protein